MGLEVTKGRMIGKMMMIKTKKNKTSFVFPGMDIVDIQEPPVSSVCVVIRRESEPDQEVMG